MKFLQKNWLRPLLERLEERAVPAFTSTSLVASATGNFTATIVTNEAQLDIDYDGATSTLTIDDASSTPLVISGVTGNVTLTVSTTTAATNAFLADLGFSGTFAGNYTLTVNRAATAATADANVRLGTSAAADILGNLKITTNSGSDSAVEITPANTMSIVGNVAVNTVGGAAARTKYLEVNPASSLTIGGGLTASNLNDILIRAAAGEDVTINGSTVLRTRAATAQVNDIDLQSLGADTDLVLDRVQIVLANTGSTAAAGSRVDINTATINSLLTMSLGVNSGASTSDVILDTVTMNGSLVSITGGNGSKTIDITDVSAPLARLTISLGNALANVVNFNGAVNTFLYTTLVGGTGINTVTGTIPSPFRLIRFSF